MTDEQFAELRSFYSEGEIVELLCAIGLFNYFNRFNNALKMEPTKPGEGGCAAPAEQRNCSVAIIRSTFADRLESSLRLQTNNLIRSLLFR